MREDRVGNRLVLPVEVEAEPVLEELADGDPVARCHLALARCEEVGTAEVAVAAEEILRAGVAGRGDLGSVFRADAKRVSAQEPRHGSFHDVRRPAERRTAEEGDESCARHSGLLLDVLSNSRGDGPRTGGDVLPRVEREDAESLLEELRRGAGEDRFEELLKLAFGDGDRNGVRKEIGQDSVGGALEGAREAGAKLGGPQLATPEVERTFDEGGTDGGPELRLEIVQARPFLDEEALLRERKRRFPARVSLDHQA